MESPANMTISPEQEKVLSSVRKLIRKGDDQRASRLMSIPTRYWRKGIDTFDEKMGRGAIFKAVAAGNIGKSIFMHGSCGTGKTHLAVALMYDWLSRHMEYANTGWDEVAIKAKRGVPLFLSAPELILKIKASWSDQEIQRAESEKGLLDKYSSVPLLVIDDLGAEKISEWSKGVFYLLIDRRYRGNKQTIVTSNLDLKRISEEVDDRISSRLCEMGVVINMGSEDYRISSI